MENLEDVSFEDAQTLEAKVLLEAQAAMDEGSEDSASSDDDDEDDGKNVLMEAIEREIGVLNAAIDERKYASQPTEAGETSQGHTTRDLHLARLNERLDAMKRKKEALEKSGRSGGQSCRPSEVMLGNYGKGLPEVVETEKDKLIRLGVLTPFANIAGFDKGVKRGDVEGSGESTPSESSYEPESDDISEEDKDMYPCPKELAQKYSASLASWRESRPRTKLVDMADLPYRRNRSMTANSHFWRSHGSNRRKRKRGGGKRPAQQVKNKRARGLESGSDPGLSGDQEEDLEDQDCHPSSYSQHTIDDADEEIYKTRLEDLGPSPLNDQGADFVEFDGGYRIPSGVYSRLFDYQKTGVKWLWELHTQKVGGIIGDEMGLGKTVQMCAFLGGLHASNLLHSALIIVPATVLRQWVQEFHTWYPWLRVVVMHDSANKGLGSKKSVEDLIKVISNSTNGILITTYDRMRICQSSFLKCKWDYVILDEGHKIRNPDADISLACKQVSTPHRIIMTGTPIQNRLSELWSLFDFVFPGRLGTLPVFKVQFAIPIQIGGYANASRFQVATAYKCAVILQDMIAPYILQRKKADVGTQLPEKKEQILFCSLTEHQRDLYRAYISSPEVTDIIEGSQRALAGIDILRKICNHPDLLKQSEADEPEDFGAPERSAKLMVTKKILRHWKNEGHKVLLFCQTQQMLNIIEDLVVKEGYSYRRMDGSTSIGIRGRIIDDFNKKDNIFLFLLTTKVGGIGVNLTGANRVLLYDPDWNPSTDIQARERAWRIGQSRDVTIYRLIVSGTIEEKIYQRQVFKLFVTNKVLKDPKQKGLFASKDMRCLFTLGDDKSTTETSNIFNSVDRDMILDSNGLQGNDCAEDAGRLCKEENGVDQEAGPSKGTSSLPLDSPLQERTLSGSDGEDCGKGDTLILRELFSKGVKSAIDHSKVECAGSAEDIATDLEACKIAREAAEKLCASRRMCQGNSVSVPTWTGRSGLSGAPAGFKQFGNAQNPRLHMSQGTDEAKEDARLVCGIQTRSAAPSSHSLLKKMQDRKFNANTVSRSNPSLESHSRLAEAWTSKVVDFLCERNGEAMSSDVISHFRTEVSSQEKSLFRSILKQVATLHKRNGLGVWAIKTEFR